MEAINVIARLLKTGSKTFSYAGTKDKRGVTVQRVVARRILPQRLAGLNKILERMALGNFEYAIYSLFSYDMWLMHT